MTFAGPLCHGSLSSLPFLGTLCSSWPLQAAPPKPRSAPARPPTHAGYVLGPVLGKGGFCSVRKALHELTGRTVACKIIEKARLKVRSSGEGRSARGAWGGRAPAACCLFGALAASLLPSSLCAREPACHKPSSPAATFQVLTTPAPGLPFVTHSPLPATLAPLTRPPAPFPSLPPSRPPRTPRTATAWTASAG